MLVQIRCDTPTSEQHKGIFIMIKSIYIRKIESLLVFHAMLSGNTRWIHAFINSGVVSTSQYLHVSKVWSREDSRAGKRPHQTDCCCTHAAQTSRYLQTISCSCQTKIPVLLTGSLHLSHSTNSSAATSKIDSMLQAYMSKRLHLFCPPRGMCM